MCIRLVLSTPMKVVKDWFYKVGCNGDNSAGDKREVEAEAAERCVRRASNLLFVVLGHLIGLRRGVVIPDYCKCSVPSR